MSAADEVSTRAGVERNLVVSAPASDELRQQLRSDSEKLIVNRREGLSWPTSEKLGVMITVMKLLCEPV